MPMLDWIGKKAVLNRWSTPRLKREILALKQIPYGIKVS